MSSQNTLRWGGLAAVLGGLLIGVPNILHPDDSDPSAFSNPLWGPVHLLIGVGVLFGLFGLICIYNRLAAKSNGLALIGFVLAFSATAMFVGIAILLEGFVIPAIAASPAAKTLLDPNGPLFGGPFGLIFLLTLVAFSLGFILLGVANWRTNTLPRWAGALAAVGATLLAFAPPLPHIAATIGGLLFGIGVAWMGFAIWSSK